ncbi:TAXI family TRAP transporter solute-binding subunit [Oscillibacter sp. MSJ-2]|uniref:TAXI family TRAP transporter solute-binding subunit n=1 Tax=Dysosmobacter acutus TaxID=2841504 RepID=A0ABS6FCN1_9FIRM|nr:TAXI family TRAP transporter solute-binding subunit [Dysosmobacter acutus]MBU5628021.1 TAXI family TRAP transporter solute-binding subunit [Dysosmobacter acutus]
MKKFLSLILALVMVASLLAGCGNSGGGGGGAASGSGSASGSGASSGGASGTPTSLSMATGGTSGTYYGFSGVLAQVLNEKLGSVLDIAVVSTGASKANIQLVDAGENQLAIVQNDVMYYAYTGTDMFDGEDACTSFSAVASCYPEEVQVIANSSITSIDQLKGKKVSVGDAGSGVEFNARQILAAYGLSFDDITVNNQSFADSADSLKNGTIDAAFVTAGAPTTAVTELSSTYTFNVLPIDDEHLAALQKDYGFYTAVTIPGGTYSCVADDVQTVAVMATIVARNDVSEDVIYEFTKGMFEYQSDIAAGHSKGELLNTETGVSGISIPFHAGAEKYYKEVGAM